MGSQLNRFTIAYNIGDVKFSKYIEWHDLNSLAKGIAMLGVTTIRTVAKRLGYNEDAMTELSAHVREAVMNELRILGG